MNRREFLSQIILAGAMAGLAAQTVAKPAFSSPGVGFHAAGRKVVFISDIHLSADANTSWINEHIEPLADFLITLNARNDIAELVILGDLLDDWMVPIDDAPSTFQQILTATHNAPVVTALQKICDNPFIKVTYVTGNHDLLSFQPQAKALIESTFSGIVISSEDPGLGDYTIDNVLWAEHGHRYSLFNSPDIWSHSGSHLPLGYFVTRLVASQSEANGTLYTSPDIIEQFVNRNLKGLPKSADRDLLIAAIFDAIALWAGKGPGDKFIMDGKDKFVKNPTVAGITRMYSPIMTNWSGRQNIVLPDMALLNEVGYMINSALLLLSMPTRIKQYYPFTPRIVLFGHTHKAFFWQRIGWPSAIYVNTGTWIDGKPMTWVEVDIQDLRFNRRSYTVSLWYEGQTSPSKSGTIVI
jgi:UDP-2,3-diacylglucosamine pyrophosphatase LpxH